MRAHQDPGRAIDGVRIQWPPARIDEPMVEWMNDPMSAYMVTVGPGNC